MKMELVDVMRLKLRWWLFYPFVNEEGKRLSPVAECKPFSQAIWPLPENF